MTTHVVSYRVMIEKSEEMIRVDIKPCGFAIGLFMFCVVWNIGFGVLFFPILFAKHSWRLADALILISLLIPNLGFFWESYLSVTWKITPTEAVAHHKLFKFHWLYSAKYITRLVYQPWKRSSSAQGSDISPCLWLETDRGRRYKLANALSDREIQSIINTLSPWFGVPISPESKYV
jgi:hypothetical protein